MRIKKELGQHFLKSQGVLKKIVEVAEISSDDIVVEIGAGQGALTEAILRYSSPKKLFAIEIDEELYEFLKEKFKNSPIEIIKADAVKVDFSKFGKELIVVGNLPYNVASQIIVKVIHSSPYIKRAVFMVQKEVALKLTLKDKKLSSLGILLNTFFDTEYIMSVPRTFFYPPPKVVSAVIKITPKKNPPIPISQISHYERFLKKIFSQKRKMLKNKLPLKILKEASVEPTKRVDELTLEDFIKLFSLWKNFS